MQTQSVCPTCGGEGRIITHKCKVCKGNGIVKGEEVITINIPAGVENGMQLSVSGKGNAAAHGGINGDLIVVIEEIPHGQLKRDGQNVLYDHYISIHLRNITEEYYKFKTTMIQNLYSKQEDILYGMGEPLNVKSNIKNGYGLFAGFNNDIVSFHFDEQIISE